MSIEIITWLKTELAKFEGSSAVKTVESDVEAIGSSAWAWIKSNGLTDLYNIALTLVSAAVPGTSWTTILASIATQAKTDGVQLLEGAESVVAAQAQADLIAAGKLIAPSTGQVVTATAAAAQPQS